ncbi:MAG: Zn-ribbon domain-containing OB-fold protein [Thermodesulfobacteriota bacterium]
MMSPETSTNIPPAVQGIFTLPPYDQNPPQLLGGFCPSCNERYFPRPKYCPRCLASVEEISLGSEGTIYSYTVVRIKPPFGLPQPYSVGYVDMGEGDLRVFCLLDPAAIKQLRIGSPVRLVVGPLGHDGRGAPRLRPYFTLREES